MKPTSALWPSTANVTTWHSAAWAAFTAATTASRSAAAGTRQKRCSTARPVLGITGSGTTPILGLASSSPSRQDERVRRGVSIIAFFAAALAAGLSLAPAGHATVPVLVIDGRGFGHGVGMAQDGALAMGKAGQSTNQILGAFYPGTGVAKGSGTVRVGVLAPQPGGVVLVFPNGGQVRDNLDGAQSPASRWRWLPAARSPSATTAAATSPSRAAEPASTGRPAVGRRRGPWSAGRRHHHHDDGGQHHHYDARAHAYAPSPADHGVALDDHHFHHAGAGLTSNARHGYVVHPAAVGRARRRRHGHRWRPAAAPTAACSRPSPHPRAGCAW